MVVLYHNADLDGLACALLMHKAYPKADMYGWNYDKRLPDFTSPIYSNQILYIVDLNLQKDLLLKLCALFYIVYLIDHHQQETLWDVPNLYTTIDTNKAACELVYDHLHGETAKYPYWIQQIARWDIHRDEGGKGWQQCMEFQFGLKHCSTYQELSKALKFLPAFIRREGKIILRYKNAMQARSEVKFATFKHDKMIYKVSISAYPMERNFIPDQGQDMHMVIAFNQSNLNIRVTLLSLHNNLDVSTIARDYGGGGHAKIAGFYSNKILENLYDE